jgi:hypothetical protein
MEGDEENVLLVRPRRLEITRPPTSAGELQQRRGQNGPGRSCHNNKPEDVPRSQRE